MKTYIVLPAYCEEKVIKKVIESIKKEGYNNIIVVDDGSSDNTYKEAKSTGVIVLKHPINRGNEATLQTVIKIAINKLNRLSLKISTTFISKHEFSSAKKYITIIFSDIIKQYGYLSNIYHNPSV